MHFVVAIATEVVAMLADMIFIEQRVEEIVRVAVVAVPARQAQLGAYGPQGGYGGPGGFGAAPQSYGTPPPPLPSRSSEPRTSERLREQDRR